MPSKPNPPKAMERRNFLRLAGGTVVIAVGGSNLVAGCSGGGSTPSATPTPTATPVPTPTPSPAVAQGRLVTTSSEPIVTARGGSNGIVHVSTIQNNVFVVQGGISTYHEYVEQGVVYYKGYVLGCDSLGNAIIALKTAVSEPNYKYFIWDGSTNTGAKLIKLPNIQEDISGTNFVMQQYYHMTANGMIFVRVTPVNDATDSRYRYYNYKNGVLDNDELVVSNSEFSVTEVYSVNSKGSIKGTCKLGTPPVNPTSYRAGVFSNGVLTALPSLFVGGESTANTISDDGRMVTGVSTDRNNVRHTVYWVDGVINDFGVSSGFFGTTLPLGNQSFIYTYSKANSAADTQMILWKSGASYPLEVQIGSQKILMRIIFSWDDNGIIYASDDRQNPRNLYAITLNS